MTLKGNISLSKNFMTGKDGLQYEKQIDLNSIISTESDQWWYLYYLKTQKGT